ncbi:hypothetical protein MP638_004678 [Amoeboaphelidium occidentale]|nr:hypothetical protein MP638_004678 [Amoeboaphelidium occidentale]
MKFFAFSASAAVLLSVVSALPHSGDVLADSGVALSQVPQEGSSGTIHSARVLGGGSGRFADKPSVFFASDPSVFFASDVDASSLDQAFDLAGFVNPRAMVPNGDSAQIDTAADRFALVEGQP